MQHPPRTLGAAAVALGLLALGSLALAPAQPSVVRAASRRQAQNPSFTFGDVTLTGYNTLSGKFGQYVTAEGANTTVDAEEPKQKSQSRIQARKITAYMTSGTSKVERVEATGNVRFSGTRPTQGSGAQSVRGTGSKGVYYRQEDRLVLSGPVTFYAEQPSPDGKSKQWVQGTASQATYDNAKQVLTFNGKVDATIAAEGLEKPAKINDADAIRLDLSERPYTFTVNMGSVNFQPKGSSQ